MPNAPKMNIAASVGILAALGLAGCAAYGGATLLRLPIEVSASPGVAVRSPDVIQTATGPRFHGSVCRGTRWLSPTRIRIERVGPDGAIIATASRPLSGLGGRGPRCVFYDLSPNWTVGPLERIRVCAGRSDTPCPTSAEPESRGDADPTGPNR